MAKQVSKYEGQSSKGSTLGWYVILHNIWLVWHTEMVSHSMKTWDSSKDNWLCVFALGPLSLSQHWHNWNISFLSGAYTFMNYFFKWLYHRKILVRDFGKGSSGKLEVSSEWNNWPFSCSFFLSWLDLGPAVLELFVLISSPFISLSILLFSSAPPWSDWSWS